MLKKTVISATLLANIVFADTYMGIDLGYAKSDTTRKYSLEIANDKERTFSNDSASVSLILGGDVGDGVKIQGRLGYIAYDEQVFPGDEGGDYSIELGGDMIKEFDVGKNLYPYVKGGIAFDFMPIDNKYNPDSGDGLSLNAGIGIDYMPTKTIGILFGIDYKYTEWLESEYSYGIIRRDVSASNSGFETYLGVRYYF